MNDAWNVTGNSTRDSRLTRKRMYCLGHDMELYSDYPISVISEYRCFSSQSHFGSCFKKQYGMTPNEYRRLNAR